MMILSLNWIHLHASLLTSFMIVKRYPVKSTKDGCVLMFACLFSVKYAKILYAYLFILYISFISTTSNYR